MLQTSNPQLFAISRQREYLADLLRDAESGHYLYGLEQTRKFFLAGGGTLAEFQTSWTLALQYQQKMKVAILDKTYLCGGGFVMYLISGRKPR